LGFSGEVVFLGDYVDPYPSEGLTDADAYDVLLQIVTFKKQNPGRVTLLVGNHELHYYNNMYESSRFSRKYYEKYNAILAGTETAGLFRVCKQIGEYLFIHAGLLGGWHSRYAKRLATLGAGLEEQLNNLFLEDKEPFYEVSKDFRGGFHEYGSPLWADINEHLAESDPFNREIIQVIGHTQMKSGHAFEWKNIRLLDNRRLYLLSDGKFTVYEA
jgi:hypothetical protein